MEENFFLLAKVSLNKKWLQKSKFAYDIEDLQITLNKGQLNLNLKLFQKFQQERHTGTKTTQNTPE